MSGTRNCTCCVNVSAANGNPCGAWIFRPERALLSLDSPLNSDRPYLRLRADLYAPMSLVALADVSPATVCATSTSPLDTISLRHSYPYRRHATGGLFAPERDRSPGRPWPILIGLPPAATSAGSIILTFPDLCDSRDISERRSYCTSST